MKRNNRKAIAILLALLMIFGIVPNPFGAGISTAFAAEPVNNALNFMGNERVSIPNAPTLTDYTLEYKLFIPFSHDDNEYPYIGIYNDKVAGKGFCLERQVDENQNPDGTYKILLYHNTDNPTEMLYSDGTLDKGRWNHIAITSNHSTNETKIYINGVLDTTDNYNSWLPDQNVVIGDDDHADQLVGCTIDDYRIWDTVRTAAEINANKDSQFSPEYPQDLVLYYDFNQGTAGVLNTGVNTLIDRISSNNGILSANFQLNGPESNWVAGAPLAEVPSSPTITPATADFDKNAPQDILVNMTLNGKTLTSIEDAANYTLVLDTDYTVSGSAITIKKEYLSAQEVGPTAITFNFSDNSTQTLSIDVSESVEPQTLGVTPSGLGTSINDPFLIATVDNLIWVQEQSQTNSFTGAYFKQTADIDLSSIANWEGIGTRDGSVPFMGNYDGNGHSISNMKIAASTDDTMNGLFNSTDGAKIEKLAVIDVQISSSGLNPSVGALVGDAREASEISDCYATGSIVSTEGTSGYNGFIGGLLGQVRTGGTVKHSYANCSVDSDSSLAGGLIGGVDASTISDSYSVSTVTGSAVQYGELIGSFYSSTLNNCYFTGDWRHFGTSNFSTINTCIQRDVATFKSEAMYTIDDYTEAWDFVSTWKFVNGVNDGFPVLFSQDVQAAAQDSTIDPTAATFDKNLAAKASIPVTMTLNGNTLSSIENNGTPLTLDTDYTVSDNTVVINVSYLESQNDGTITLTFKFSEGDDQNLDITITDTTPESIEPEGLGTADDPYIMESVGNLAWLAEQVNSDENTQDFAGVYFEQTSDIDLQDIPWLPIGFQTAFKGNYDGQGYSISNITVSGDYGAAGLFGFITNATIENLGVINANVKTTKTPTSYAGAIAGFMNNASTITNCYSTGTIQGVTIPNSGSYVGGLVGVANGAAGQIDHSYTLCSVSGGRFDGGIAGSNRGTMIDVYYGGNSVDGTFKGALVGYTDGNTIISYAYAGENNAIDLIPEPVNGTVDSNSVRKIGMAVLKNTATNYDALQGFFADSWDFTDIWTISADVNGGFPTLIPYVPPSDVATVTISGLQYTIDEQEGTISGNQTPITTETTVGGFISNIIIPAGATYKVFKEGTPINTAEDFLGSEDEKADGELLEVGDFLAVLAEDGITIVFYSIVVTLPPLDADYIVTNNAGDPTKFDVSGVGTNFANLAAALNAIGLNGSYTANSTIQFGPGNGVDLLVGTTSTNNNLISARYTGNIKFNYSSYTTGLIIPSGVTAVFQQLSLSNNNAMNQSYEPVRVYTNGDLTIKEGTSLSTKYVSYQDDSSVVRNLGGAIHVLAGTIDGDSNTQYGIWNEDGTLEVSGGLIESKYSQTYGAAIKTSDMTTISGIAMIRGTTFGIDAGKSSDDFILAVNGGMIEATGAGAAIRLQNMDLAMTDGIVRGSYVGQGGNGIVVITSNGTASVDITGGQVISRGTAANDAAIAINGVGTTTISGTALISGYKNGIAFATTNPVSNHVTISGGTVESTEVGADVNSNTAAVKIPAVAIGTVTWTGGIIKSENSKTVLIEKHASTPDNAEFVIGTVPVYRDTNVQIQISGELSNGVYVMDYASKSAVTLNAQKIVAPKTFSGWFSDAARTSVLSTALTKTFGELTQDGVSEIYAAAAVPAQGPSADLDSITLSGAYLKTTFAAITTEYQVVMNPGYHSYSFTVTPKDNTAEIVVTQGMTTVTPINGVYTVDLTLENQYYDMDGTGLNDVFITITASDTQENEYLLRDPYKIIQGDDIVTGMYTEQGRISFAKQHYYPYEENKNNPFYTYANYSEGTFNISVPTNFDDETLFNIIPEFDNSITGYKITRYDFYEDDYYPSEEVDPIDLSVGDSFEASLNFDWDYEETVGGKYLLEVTYDGEVYRYFVNIKCDNTDENGNLQNLDGLAIASTDNTAFVIEKPSSGNATSQFVCYGYQYGDLYGSTRLPAAWSIEGISEGTAGETGIEITENGTVEVGSNAVAGLYLVTATYGELEVTQYLLVSENEKYGVWSYVSTDGVNVELSEGNTGDEDIYVNEDVFIINNVPKDNSTFKVTVSKTGYAPFVGTIKRDGSKWLQTGMREYSTNAYLWNLSDNANADWNQNFDMSTYEYLIGVGTDVTSIKLTPEADDSTATIKVNGVAVNSGDESSEIQLNADSDTTITVVVTAEDGTTTKTYTITVRHGIVPHASNNAKLDTIAGKTISEGGEAGTYDAPITASINVAYEKATIAASDILAEDDAATVYFYGKDSTFDSQETGSVDLTSGEATKIYVKVTAEDGTEAYYEVTVNRAASGGGSGGGHTTPSTPSTQTPVVTGTETKTTEEGKSVVTVEVNNDVIDGEIDDAIKNNPSGEGNLIQIPVVDTSSEIVKVELTGDIVKKLEENTFDVSIKRDDVEYLIPAEEFTISKVAENLGVPETDLKDIIIEVKITKLDDTIAAKYAEAAKANGAELVFPPVEFEIVAKTTNADGTVSDVSISKFSNYVERIMEIPTGVDPSKITTGIVFNSDGTYSHVPTEVFQKDGKWYAKLNSLTNSDYSVIWNPVTVKSVENHWSKEAVNDMASRLVVFDPENFVPDKAITRADFAEYIIRALGLYREGTHDNKFKDVSATGDRTLAILIASEYGIVTGYPDGTFRPDALITREEAMTMYQRAMKVTKLVGSDQNRYQSYTDYSLVSGWAKVYVQEVLSAHVFNGNTATTISPKSNLTYAEAAQAIRNLLVESKLINE